MHNDPIYNYLHTKKLLNQNVIDCDYEATNLLNKGVKFYVSEMTNKYSFIK